MKITLRIESDKSHSIKRSFSSLEEVAAFVQLAKTAQTKARLKSWLRCGTNAAQTKTNSEKGENS